MVKTNIEKDFENIKKLHEEKRNKIKILEDEVYDESRKFLDNYKLENKLKSLGGLNSLLNRRLSVKEFLNLLEDEYPLAMLPLTGKREGGKLTESEDEKLFNYNKNLLKTLEESILNQDSLNSAISTNDLNSKTGGVKYLINNNLKNLLKEGYNLKINKLDREYFYMVVFNVVKVKGEYTLIYNYIAYNKIFLELMYAYISIEQLAPLLRGKEGYMCSDLFFIIEKELYTDNSDMLEIKEDLASITFSKYDLNYLEQYWYNIIQLFKWSVNGEVLTYNSNNIANLLNILKKDQNDEVKIIKTLNSDLDLNVLSSYYKERPKTHTIFNYLSRFVFLVSDLKAFLNVIKLNNNIEVNQGPQKIRGNSNLMSYTLFHIDNGFRSSMYNHNEMYSRRDTHSQSLYNNYIAKSCFSYKNVHINLGNVKWYSTSNKNLKGISNNKELSEESNKNDNNRKTEENSKIDSIFFNDTFKLNNSFKLIFNNLLHILNNNPINKKTQINLETYLYNQYKDTFLNKEKLLLNDVDFNIFNKGFKEHCLNIYSDLNYYIDSIRSSYNSNKNIAKDINNINKTKLIMDYYIKEIMKNLENKEILNYIFYSLFVVVTYNNMISEEDNYFTNKINTTTISINLGKFLVNKHIYLNYKKHKKENENENISFSEYKKYYLSLNKNMDIVTDSFYLHLSSKFIEIGQNCNIWCIKIEKMNNKSISILSLTKDMEQYIKQSNPISVLPISLPMIVPPKPFTDKTLGGYLLNDVEYEDKLFTIKEWYKIPSTINKVENNNIIYNVVNNIMKTPFKINKPLLNYLLDYNKDHGLLMDSNVQHSLTNIKRNKRQEKEYQRYLSKKTSEQYIILIAKLFANIPEIYFPVKLDQRGRLYATTAYFNYQASELAKALILFAIPDTIEITNKNAIEYLKAYGANCYGNGLNRKSYNKRLEWVDSNWDEIINFENSGLVNKADNKYLFLAFCIEMRRYHVFLSSENTHEFKTYLPIQLDGTCNGFQHLAMLSNETEIFKSLNLSSSKKHNDPEDFYTHILEILTVHLENKKQKHITCRSPYYMVDSEDKSEKNFIKDKDIEIKDAKKDNKYIESINRLLQAGINRNILKPSIMNKPYNATNKTLTKYIMDLLIFDRVEKNKETNKNIYWYKVNKNTNSCINISDIELLVENIEEIIYVKYPKIKLLTEYFKKIGIILNKLNLAIVWRLPSGLVVSQQYMAKKTLKIEPYTFLSNSLTLTITDKIRIDKRKQISAFMPNLVHSLDAATLSLLYNSFYKTLKLENNKHVNFYSIHDCYGVSAKYVETLIQMLRTIYIDIYSVNTYIQKFDEDVISSIIASQGEEKCKFDKENRTIIIEKRKEIILPEISSFLNVPNKYISYESLSKSIFLIK